MEPHRTTKTVTFKHPFTLPGIGRVIAAGDYQVLTEEELIEGLSFAAFRRISTVMFVPGAKPHASSIEMLTIDPAELAAAQERDAG
jgi:hypothetical protein